MQGYTNRKIANYKFFRLLRHIGYRIGHYGKKAISLPGRILEYVLGSFCYKNSPYQCHMTYKEFTREHGRYGELQLWRRAKRYFPKDTVWFRNLYLPKEDNTTLEIDLVAVSRKGIFVFESKNYIGMIFGEASKPHWYQLIRKDLRYPPVKYTFFNPIMQNSMHCRNLARILERDRSRIYSFVVFGNGCRLKKIQFDSDKTIVCRRNAIGKHIQKYKYVMSGDEVDSITEKLTPFSDHSHVQKYRHLRALETKKKNLTKRLK